MTPACRRQRWQETRSLFILPLIVKNVTNINLKSYSGFFFSCNQYCRKIIETNGGQFYQVNKVSGFC